MRGSCRFPRFLRRFVPNFDGFRWFSAITAGFPRFLALLSGCIWSTPVHLCLFPSSLELSRFLTFDNSTAEYGWYHTFLNVKILTHPSKFWPSVKILTAGQNQFWRICNSKMTDGQNFDRPSKSKWPKLLIYDFENSDGSESVWKGQVRAGSAAKLSKSVDSLQIRQNWFWRTVKIFDGWVKILTVHQNQNDQSC